MPSLSAPILVLAIALIALTPATSPAASTFGGYGVSAGASTSSNCPSFCTGDFDFDSSGGEFSGFASATSMVYGEARAEAFYDKSNAYLPVLKAFSSSTSGRGGSASAFGVQGYTYEGTESRQIEIAFELDANVLDSNSFGSESASASIGILGVSGLFRSNPAEYPSYQSDFGTWYFENVGTQLGTESRFVNSPNGLAQGSVSFTVNPGDIFFVGATLSAISRTGTADAFNTFTAVFEDPAVISQLTIANPVAAIPEPTSLSGLSIVTIGWYARRRRQR